MGPLPWKTILHFFPKVQRRISMQPSNPTADINPEEVKTGAQTNTRTFMLIAASFTTANRLLD